MGSQNSNCNNKFSAPPEMTFNIAIEYRDGYLEPTNAACPNGPTSGGAGGTALTPARQADS